VTSAGLFGSTVDCYNIKIAVFWDVVPHNVVAMYQRFWRKLLPPPSVWNTHVVNPEDGGSPFLRNSGTCL
jgi:hypothetical protein